MTQQPVTKGLMLAQLGSLSKCVKGRWLKFFTYTFWGSNAWEVSQGKVTESEACLVAPANVSKGMAPRSKNGLRSLSATSGCSGHSGPFFSYPSLALTLL